MNDTQQDGQHSAQGGACGKARGVQELFCALCRFTCEDHPETCACVCPAVLWRVVQELLEIKHNSWKFTLASMTLRTGLLGVVVLTAIAVPFFASVMSFIGSFMATSVAVVLPCLFVLKICRHQLSRLDVGLAICMAVFGVVVGVVGTYNAIMNISSKY